MRAFVWDFEGSQSVLKAFPTFLMESPGGLNGFYYVLNGFKLGLGWLVNAYSSHSIHNRSGPNPKPLNPIYLL